MTISYGYPKSKLPLELDLKKLFAVVPEKSILIMFYAKWCSNCHRLMPKFREMAVEHADKLLTATLDCVETTDTNAMCIKLGVNEFPTFIHFNNNRMIKYYGDRSMVDLLDFSLVRAKDSWVDRSEEVFIYDPNAKKYYSASADAWQNMSIMLIYAIGILIATFAIWKTARCIFKKRSDTAYYTIFDLPTFSNTKNDKPENA